MDVTKLPKWAQTLLVSKDREISNLTHALEAHKALAETRASEALGPTWQAQGAYLDPHNHNIPIGEGHVRFNIRETRGFWDYIDCRLIESQSWGRYVDIHGSRGILIRPIATNSTIAFIPKTDV